jgi:GT2 family glycosyltransferase
MLAARTTKVGLIVVNWNSGALLTQCLGAVFKQSYLPEKIVVVDNASNDQSLRVIKGDSRECSRVQIIELSKNMGFALANNMGVKEASDCDYFALLNPDAIPEPTWLQSLVEAAEINTEYSFFASHMLQARSRELIDGTGDVYHVSGLAWRRDYGSAAAQVRCASGEIFSPCAGAALYRRDAFAEAGGFDESFFCYFEDVDLGLRLGLMGYRCLYVSDAVVYHVGSATTGGQQSNFAVYHGHRNLVWTYFKDMPWPLLWLYLPQHLLLNLVTLVWFTLRGQGWVIFKAKWDALKGLPRVLRERRRVQGQRRVSAWALRRVMARGMFTPYFRRRI